MAFDLYLNELGWRELVGMEAGTGEMVDTTGADSGDSGGGGCFITTL